MDQVLILLHAGLGGIALLSGTIAIITKKGRLAHKRSGKVFHFSMLSSALLALLITFLPGHYNPFLFSIGVFTTYFLLGGYRALRYRQPDFVPKFDRITSLTMLTCAVGMILIPLLYQGQVDVVLTVFGGISIVFVMRDLSLYRDPKKLREAWLRLHISKMSGAYIASVSAFLVVNEIFHYYLNWLLPTLLGSIYIAFWTRKTRRKDVKVGGAALIMLLFHFAPLSAQVYTEKQSRHRFAQLSLGLDYQTSLGGKTTFLNASGNLESLDLGSIQKPRFLIGGTHFWGHADFYIAIPIAGPSFESNNQDIFFTSGVETIFKYYPWRIEHHRLRPFVGFSIAPFFYQQDNLIGEGTGPEKLHLGFPLLSGFTYNHQNFLLELGLNYNYSNSIDYFISRSREATIQTPPLYLYFSLRYMLETTLSAEKGWESGETARITDHLAAKGQLNNFFIGAGMSSAWWLGNSSYNQSERPFLPGYGISLMPDFSLGYYLHQPDINLALNYRSYNGGGTTYGVRQSLKRRSISLEATKYVLDYHGFAPFIGPAISYENLRFRERFEQEALKEFQDQKIAFGIAFGWDIRPNRLQTFLLRTNLRYFPSLKLDVAGNKQINFSNIEFNFIQLIVFPERLF